VKGAPPIVPFTAAKGILEGIVIDEGVDPLGVPKLGIASLSVAETGRPPAVPPIELTVGVAPLSPVHVMVATPGPSGMLVSRETSATTGPASSAESKLAATIPIMA
jgi:hypothetical protein